MRAHDVFQDLRFGLRQLRLNPTFAAVAVLSLALGIGANTAIFQLIDAVRLRTLPVRAPQELAYIDFAKDSTRSGNWSTRSARLTSAVWDEVRARQRSFAGVFAWSATRFNLTEGGKARYAEGVFVSGDFFPVLGVGPVLGRLFTRSDDVKGCGSPGAVLSHAFWQAEFGGDPNVLARTVRLVGRPFNIIGVAPAGFAGVEIGNRFDVALPLCADPLFDPEGKGRAVRRDGWWLSAMGRLKPGQTLEQAEAQIRNISPAVMQASLPPRYRPDTAKRYLANKLALTRGATGVSDLRRQYENPLWILLATTGLVLLIACANLANLLLARASVREREIAVRQAIGASRGRLITQLLSESLLLALLGSALGGLFAGLLSRALVTFLTTSDNGLFVNLGLDWRVFGFAGAMAAVTCVLFGLAPALRATRITPASAMRSSGRGLTAGREGFSLRRGLVVAQVSLSLVLLTGALLFVRSLQKLLDIDPGFRSEGIVVVDVDMRPGHYSKDRIPEARRQLLADIRARTGSASGAFVRMTPVSGSSWDQTIWMEGSAHKDCLLNWIGPDYFQTMGSRLIAGREFTNRDDLKAPMIAIVNEEFARQYFGGRNPVGQVFHIEGSAGKPDEPYQIVGLVQNTKYRELREDFRAIAFRPATQDDDPDPYATYVLRTNGPVGEFYRNATAATAAMHSGFGLDFRVLTSQLRESLTRDSLMAALAGVFGLLAVALAVLGLYGVIAYMVARRRNEIGVRIALGASRGRVIRLVLREAMLLLGLGLFVGVALSAWVGQVAASLLYGLKPRDPATLSAAVLLLAAVALVASYAPARKASRLEPMDALRDE